MKNVYTTSSFPGFLNPLLKKAMQLNSKIIALLIICLLSSVSLFAIPPSAIKYVKPAATGTGDGSSWANASADLQGMIDASNEYEQVWVAAGTYKPLREPTNTAADNLNGSNRNYAYVLKDKVKVYGGFVGTETTLLERTDAVILANPSILSGANASPSTSDDLYHVVISVNDDANTVLNGFTIQNGKADGGSGNIIVETSADPINPYKIVKNHGGGLHIYESNPTIEKCIFQSSIAKNYGGGIYNYKSSPAITSCVFISNSTIDLYGGGIYNAEASNPYIYNCTFTSNSSIYGGGIYNSSEVNPRIEKCIFTSNSATLNGGGIYTANASPDIVNCVFDANTAIYYGAGIYNSVSSSRIINCLFNNNSAVSGGGIYNSEASSSIINCTFYKNNAGLTGFGGAIYNTIATSEVKIQNSIFKENKRANAFATGADIKNENEAKVTVSNTLLQFQNNSTNYPGVASISGFQGAGTGNFYTTDPFFVTPSSPKGTDNIWGTADDGLRLQNCSPILNVGNNSFNPTGTYAFDLSGINLRINPTYTPLNVDLGAYENEFGTMLVGISRNPNTPTPHPYVCVGETTTFTASPTYPGLFPMYEFFLNNVSVQSGVNSTYTLNSLANADQIRVTLTSQACTAKSDTITMVVHAPVLVTQTNSPVCAEQTLTFTSENSVSNIGNSYLWTGPGFNLPNTSQSPEFINATVGLSGKYFLKVTDTYGCITRDTLDLLVNPLPIPLTANTSDTSFVCVGQPLKFSSTNTGVSVNNFFQWTGNAFTSTGTDQNPVFLYATEAMSGKHYVTIEDNNGCKQIDSTVVLVNSIPVPSASDNTPVCAGQIIEFFSEDTRTVPPLPLIFAWSGPASYSSAISNPQIDSAAMNMNGVYKVIIEDAKGCKDSTTTTVVVRSLPIPVQTYNNPVCAEDSIFLFSTDTRDPNFPTYDYTWRGPKAFGSSLQNPKIPESTVDMSGEYFLTMTDVFGCVDSSKFDVLVHSLPIPKLSYNPHVCQEDTLKLNIIDLRTTQEPTYSYAWEGPLGFDTTAQGFSIPNSVVNMTGMYYVNVTDQYGCAEFDSIDVIVNSLPIPSANSNSPVCSAETLNLYTSDTRNPNAASYTYSWTGPNSYSSELQNPIFNSVDVSLSGIYEITITDNFGCSGSSSTEVVNHHPKATAVNDGPYDEGDNVNLLATGGTRFDWQGPNGFTSNLVNPSFPDGKPANSGIYSVTVTYQFCTATATTAVNIACNTPTMSYYLIYSDGIVPEVITPISDQMEIQKSSRPMTIVAIPACESPEIKSVKMHISGTTNQQFSIVNQAPFYLHENSGQIGGDVLVNNLYTFIARGFKEITENDTALIVGPDVIQYWIVNGDRKIRNVSPSTQSICSGSSFTLTSDTTGGFSVGNIYQAFLSTSDGKFDKPTLIGSSTNPSSISCTIPNYINGGSNYKVMVRSSSPVVSSEPSSVALNIIPANYKMISPTHDIDNINTTRQAIYTIAAKNRISGTAKVTYKAQYHITLEPGFEANSGTVFLAEMGSACVDF